MEYILFQCMECKQMIAYPGNTADGHRCNHCKGMLKPINKGTRKQLEDRYIADIEFPVRGNKRAESNITINLQLKDINKISTGLRLVNALSWKHGEEINFDSILESDKETKNIIIKESDLMRLIQLVIPNQKDRHIVLVNDVEHETKHIATLYNSDGTIAATHIKLDC